MTIHQSGIARISVSLPKALLVKHEFLDEVISALNVNLIENRTLSVLLVQGPADKLKKIADRMIACCGVILESY